MDNSLVFQAALWAALAVVVYAVIARGMFRATESVRYAALDLAAELIAAPELPDLDKQVIQATLGHLHSPAQAWWLAAKAIVITFTWPFRTKRSRTAAIPLPKELARKYDSYQTCWIVGTVANSPAAAFIFVLCTALIMAFAAGGLFSALLFNGHDQNNHHGPKHVGA